MIIIDEIINMSESGSKRQVMSKIAPLQGLHEVMIKPVRGTRRQRANAFYFAAVVKPFQEFESAQGNHITRLEAHEMLKRQLLPVNIVNKHGEVIGTVGASSHDKSIPEFAAYVTRCKEWLFDMCGITCEEPAGEFDERTP